MSAMSADCSAVDRLAELDHDDRDLVLWMYDLALGDRLTYLAVRRICECATIVGWNAAIERARRSDPELAAKLWPVGGEMDRTIQGARA